MNGLRHLNQAALAAAGASILVMTLIGGIDVLTSALLGKPIPTVYEATETLMVMVVFLSLGHLQIENGHIAVDFVQRRLPLIGRRIVAMASQLTALTFYSLLTWQAWLMATESWRIREYSVGLIQFPIYPSKFAVVVGAALAVLCSVAQLVRIALAKQSESDPPDGLSGGNSHGG